MQYQRALDLVADLFRDVRRKVSDLPYIVHLVGVAYIVSSYTDDETVIVAALLHDVLEDISEEVYSGDDMRRDFGDKVIDIVKTVSHDSVRYTKAESRRQYLKQINEGSLEACLVSAADLLHNSRDLLYWHAQQPEAVEIAFGEGSSIRAWFWQERYEIIARRLGSSHGIVNQLSQLMDDINELHTSLNGVEL